MPFVTAGDPDLDFTAEVIRRLAARGCSLFELGIPYSDPIADGPVIQASYTRALDRKIKLADILAMVGRLTSERRTAPSPGTACDRGRGSGAEGRRPPFRRRSSRCSATRSSSGTGWSGTWPTRRRRAWRGRSCPTCRSRRPARWPTICRREDFSLIQLITPTTPRDRALRIAERTTGFIYYVSVTGITGERTALPPEIVENVAWLREQTPLPICIGFGISRPEHVRMLAPVADGLIVGSAIVRRIAEAATKPREQVLARNRRLRGRIAGGDGTIDDSISIASHARRCP